MPISTPPTAPARNQAPATYIGNMDAFLAWIAAMVPQANALEVNVNAKDASASAAASTATTKAQEAAASEAGATAAANVTKWISGTNYAEGVCTWSPTDYITYRRKAPGGVSTTDPASDSTGWASIGSPITLAGVNAIRANIALVAFNAAVVGSLSVQKLIDGVVDEFEDQTGIDDPNCTSVNYDSTVDCYVTGASYSFSGGSGNRTSSITVTTNLAITNGTINNLVDGGLVLDANDSVQWTYDSNIAGNYIQFDFGAGVTKLVSEIRVLSGTEPTTFGTWKWQGSNDGSAWTDLNGAGQLWTSATINTFALTNSTAYRYYRMLGVSGGLDCAGGLSSAWKEVEFKISAGPTSVLISEAATAMSVPNTASLVVWEEDVTAATLNTDLLAFVSREAGVTFTTNYATNNKLAAAGQGFQNGDRVIVTSSAQNLPAGLAASNVYYVVNRSANDFELSLTAGGATVALTGNGTGTHTARRYTQVTLTQSATLTTGRVLTGSADISSQTAGTAMRYALVAANSKAVNFHGVALQWS